MLQFRKCSKKPFKLRCPWFQVRKKSLTSSSPASLSEEGRTWGWKSESSMTWESTVHGSSEHTTNRCIYIYICIYDIVSIYIYIHLLLIKYVSTLSTSYSRCSTRTPSFCQRPASWGNPVPKSSEVSVIFLKASVWGVGHQRCLLEKGIEI